MSKNTVGFLNSALRKKLAAAALLSVATVGSAQALTLSSAICRALVCSPWI